MPRLLIDENVNQGILRGIKLRLPHLDFVLVRDIGLEGAPDVQLLRWAAQSERVVLTHDVKTMTRDAIHLVRTGQQMASVIVVPQSLSTGAAFSDLEIVLEWLSQSEARNKITYVPL